jgi:hypothetical protein
MVQLGCSCSVHHVGHHCRTLASLPCMATGKLAHPMLREHFADLVGIPMSALIAMCVVILLRFSAGPIEFEGLSFKFRGASGQVVF